MAIVQWPSNLYELKVKHFYSCYIFFYELSINEVLLFTLQKIEDLVTCGICYEYMETPVLTICSHNCMTNYYYYYYFHQM